MADHPLDVAVKRRSAGVTSMLNLNDLLDDSGAGWVLLYGKSINDSGQITGTGIFKGQFRAFLLTPSKERKDKR